MFRFLFRFTGLWVLAGAFVTLVIDGTRSVSASRFVFSPVRDAWSLIDPASLDAAQKKAAGGYAELLFGLFLSMPFCALLGAVGLLLLLIGRRRRSQTIGYSSRD